MIHLAPLFASLSTVPGGFRCVHADPPIRYRSNSRARPGRNAMRHYRCYDYADFEALPVADVVADNAWLALWVPGPWLALGAHVPLMRAWGFAPSGMGFTWVKQNRSGEGLFMGPGHTTRKNAEFCVLGRRGKPERLSKSVHEVIIAPLRAHSQKPAEIYTRLERFCPGPRLDLFARQRRENWVSYGDQTSMFDFGGPNERLPLERADVRRDARDA
jgi:N6-adenosine-specific RNA methylase IME4